MIFFIRYAQKASCSRGLFAHSLGAVPYGGAGGGASVRSEVLYTQLKRLQKCDCEEEQALVVHLMRKDWARHRVAAFGHAVAAYTTGEHQLHYVGAAGVKGPCGPYVLFIFGLCFIMFHIPYIVCNASCLLLGGYRVLLNGTRTQVS